MPRAAITNLGNAAKNTCRSNWQGFFLVIKIVAWRGDFIVLCCHWRNGHTQSSFFGRAKMQIKEKVLFFATRICGCWMLFCEPIGLAETIDRVFLERIHCFTLDAFQCKTVFTNGGAGRRFDKIIKKIKIYMAKIFMFVFILAAFFTLKRNVIQGLPNYSASTHPLGWWVYVFLW